jgi:hypothetical protein
VDTDRWNPPAGRNYHRKLLICTERRQRVVDLWSSVANALILTGILIHEAASLPMGAPTTPSPMTYWRSL